MPGKSLVTRFPLDDCGNHRCHSGPTGVHLQEELGLLTLSLVNSSALGRILRSPSLTPCQCLEKCRLETSLRRRWMRLKHHTLKSRSSLQRYRGGKSAKSTSMEKRNQRLNHRYRQRNRRLCDSPPRCNIKYRTFAVHRFESIRFHLPCISVPTALNRRSRSTPSQYRGHPHTSAPLRMHLAHREALFPVSPPTSRTIRTRQHPRAKSRLCQTVDLRCPSKRVHASL